MQRWYLRLGVLIHGDAAAVVADAEAAIHVDLHVNVMAMPRKRLINAVIDQLVSQLMQPAGAGIADVHARPLPNVRGITVHLDVIGSVRTCIIVSIRKRRLIACFVLDNYDHFVVHDFSPLSRHYPCFTTPALNRKSLMVMPGNLLRNSSSKRRL